MGILAAIAIPAFSKYQSKAAAAHAEGLEAQMEMEAAMEAAKAAEAAQAVPSL